MTHKVFNVFAVLAATFLSSVAIALDDKDRGDATFKAMDADRDSRLTQNEVSGDPMLAQHFAALDRDSDGYLTKREYAAHLKGNKNGTKEEARRPY